ncbi:MAG: response regulator [Lentimicrobiaceae bacterium]|nr:response regulator [Lentimicrobiaceae bacterium]MCO5266686.1 response regulator [Lentimicrobium sp.]HPG32401.1 response regulator [Lentimicrobium sp.]
MKPSSENLVTTMGSDEKLIKVLIAEDNVLNQKIIEILIKRMGWDYKLVADGVEAVSECFKDSYDVILMDIDMPQMNGWEATIEIRRKKMNIPIIALTAYSEESFRKKSFEAGMDYFLSKPYNKEEIYETIKKCVKVS